MPEHSGVTPLADPGLADYHCHPDYSIDARGTVEEFCEAALKRNLAEICFTTHYDANPLSESGVGFIRVDGKMLPVSPDNLGPYVDHVRRAADHYYPLGLSVKLGIEIGWFHGCEEIVEELLGRYKFDHILCGIHELDNICFCCSGSFQKSFSRYSAEEMVEAYFSQAISASRSGLFDCLAHLEYYLKYGLEYYGEGIRAAGRRHFEALFKALIESGTALEVNTAGIRHGLGEYYPGMAMTNDARRAGVNVGHLGSDAHRPDQVGFEFEAASALVPHPVWWHED